VCRLLTVVGGGTCVHVQVDCLTLPQFIEEQQIENLDLIKMDTEGAESIILPSFKSWLMKQSVLALPCLPALGTSTCVRTKGLITVCVRCV
jgi:hypothetical protein